MSRSVETLTTVQVLVATRAGHLLALPMARIGRASHLHRSPRLPATAPWLAGAARCGNGVLWLIDLPGADTITGEALALLAEGTDPRWALRIDRVDGLSTAVAGGPAGWDGWPAGWTRGCLLGDGRRATLVDPDAIGRAVVREAA